MTTVTSSVSQRSVTVDGDGRSGHLESVECHEVGDVGQEVHLADAFAWHLQHAPVSSTSSQWCECVTFTLRLSMISWNVTSLSFSSSDADKMWRSPSFETLPLLVRSTESKRSCHRAIKLQNITWCKQQFSHYGICTHRVLLNRCSKSCEIDFMKSFFSWASVNGKNSEN